MTHLSDILGTTDATVIIDTWLLGHRCVPCRIIRLSKKTATVTILKKVIGSGGRIYNIGDVIRVPMSNFYDQEKK